MTKAQPTTVPCLPYGYGRQTVSDANVAAVVEALQSEFLNTGPAPDRFETRLAEATGAPHVAA